MHDAHEAAADGVVTDVFAHRFVIKTDQKTVLADLTPRGAELISLKVGDTVHIEGDQKPSELKVSRMTVNGRAVDLGDAPHHDNGVDLDWAKQVATEAGYLVIGEPRKKPKHYEILGRKNGRYAELHIHRDGLRHERPVGRDDAKWSSELSAQKA